MSKTDQDEIIKEINEFLTKHANSVPDYDPKHDAVEDRFTGPDPIMLYAAAIHMENGNSFTRVFSDWGSGCYSPYGDNKAREWHDNLVERVNNILLENDFSKGPSFK